MKPSHKVVGHLITSIGIIAILVAVGCGTQPTHPNQLNTFDGTAYDALILTQGALNSLRSPISATYPRYAPAFNDAAKAYWTAVTAYRTWRASENDTGDILNSLANVATNVVALETAIECDFETAPEVTAKVQRRASKFRAQAQRSLTAPDILVILKAASAFAQSVDTTELNRPLAELILGSTEAAINSFSATVDQPIDTTALAPIAPIA